MVLVLLCLIGRKLWRVKERNLSKTGFMFTPASDVY